MKPIPLIIGGVVGVAALWSAGWYAGKALYVEPEADAAVEALRGGSLFFSYDTRNVSGFPFGYDVTYEGVAVSDASNMWQWQADWASLQTSVADSGVVTATVAPGSSLVVEQPLFGGQASAPPVVFDITSTDLLVQLSGDDADRRIQAEAASVTVLQKSAAAVVSGGEGRLTNLEADMQLRPANGAYVGDITADLFAFSYRLSLDGVSETTSESEMTDIAITFDTRAFAGGDVAAMLANDGAVRMELTAGGYTGGGASSGGPSRPPVVVSYSGDNTTALIDIGEGRARYAGDAEGMVVNVKVDAPGPFPGPAFTVNQVEISLEMPLKQAAEAQPYLIAMKVGDLDPDASLWSVFDAGGVLNRDKMELDAKITGVARVLTDFAGAGVGQSPIDLETLVLDTFELEALGVEASAEGAFEIAGDAGRSDGEMDVTIEGGFALLDDLVAAGLVPQEAAGAYRGLLLQFGAQDGDDDVLKSKIESRNGVVSVNGQVVSR